MTLSEVKTKICSIEPKLRLLDVAELSVFGSVARGDSSVSSDIDFLVKFAHSPTFKGYFSVKELLESEFACEIDLVTPGALKPDVKEVILVEAVRVA